MNFTPYALALASQELRDAALLLRTSRFPVTNFLLFAMSIELGLKAAVLNRDNTQQMKDRLKGQVGHDLLKANEEYESATASTLFNTADEVALQKLNRFFKGKHLEYFTVVMIEAMYQAFAGFPPLDEIAECSRKVSEMLAGQNNFL